MSEHFNIQEFTFSQTAQRKDIDNSIPPKVIGNAYRTMDWLDVLRGRLNTIEPPHSIFRKDAVEDEIFITISSGYRCPTLNKLIGGSRGSAHMKALAADINARYYTAPQLFEFICNNMNDMPFDQVILEHGRWVHVGLAESSKEPRGQLLTASLKPTGWGGKKTVYELIDTVKFKRG